MIFVSEITLICNLTAGSECTGIVKNNVPSNSYLPFTPPAPPEFNVGVLERRVQTVAKNKRSFLQAPPQGKPQH